MNTLIWLSTYQAAERAGRNDQTVRRACESGELHGAQRKARGTWRIHVDCLDAWVLGMPCPHEKPTSKSA